MATLWNRRIVAAARCAALAGVWLAAQLAMSDGRAASPEVAVPAFQRFAGGPVKGVSSGELLLGELNCVACHKPSDAVRRRLDSKQPPLLGSVANRVTEAYLRDFLSDPHHVKPGTGMPDLLASLDEPTRARTVDSLVNFLSTLGDTPGRADLPPSQEVVDKGRVLYHTVGCIACHAPQEPVSVLGGKSGQVKETVSPNEGKPEAKVEPEAAPRPPRTAETAPAPVVSVPLGDLGRKTTRTALAKFLMDPLKVRPSGRMPSQNLTKDEAAAISGYLLRDQSNPPPNTLAADDDTAGVDFRYFADQGTDFPPFDAATPARAGGVVATFVTVARHSQEFAEEFRGFLEIGKGGPYTFEVDADGLVRLAIDGKELLRKDLTRHKMDAAEVEPIKKPEPLTAAVTLDPGRHAIEAGYATTEGHSKFVLLYEGPDATKRAPVPAGRLFRAPQPRRRSVPTRRRSTRAVPRSRRSAARRATRRGRTWPRSRPH